MTAIESVQSDSASSAAMQTPPVVYSPGISYHLSLLLLCSAVVSLSLLLSTRGPEQVIVPIVNLPLPGLCMSKNLFNAECPGCGMTRCFISLAHGDLQAAWNFNPAGLLFFALVVSQIPLRAIQIWRIRTGRPELGIGRWQWPLFVVVGLMLVQWGVKTIVGAIG
jgi:hypothetical protein